MNTSLSVQAIDTDVCVAAQLMPEAMAEAALAGFRSVINNRPDFEGGPSQPTSAQIATAAQAAGLEYRHLSVSPTVQTAEEAAALAALLKSLPRPVLLFCRSGGRSTRLYQLASQA